MPFCDACRIRPASFHVTLLVSIFGPQGERQKRAHFWLCPECELSSRQVLSCDELQAERLAFRLVCHTSPPAPIA